MPPIDYSALSSLQNGATSLHIAAAGGHYSVAELLLTKGAVLSATDIEGNTALHYAAIHGHDDIAASLLRHGSSIIQFNKVRMIRTWLLFILYLIH